MSGKNSSTYRTLDLIKAISFGWGNHHDLLANEMQVLMFIAQRGKTSEDGYAFAWFPLGGQDWWAAHMGLSLNRLKKALSNLRRKGLIVDIPGSKTDARFLTVKGYAVTINVMEEAKEWYLARNDVRFQRAPDTLEGLEVPEGNSQVPERNFEVPERNFDTTSEQGFCPTYPYKEPEKETQLFTQTDRPAGAPSGKEEMNFEDEWSVPKEELEKKKAKRTPSGTNAVCDLFYDEWSKARIQRKSLAIPWSSKMAFQARLKDLLSENSTEEVFEMVRTFFRMVLAGQIPLKSDDLWKDFWNNRGKIIKVVNQKSASKPSGDPESDLERWRKRVYR